MKKANIFSTYSLKLLDESIEEYKKRYVEGTQFNQSSKDTKLGKKFHALIAYYLKGFDVSKFERMLSQDESTIWQALKKDAVLKNEFVKAEYSFLVKEEKFYLTGRFDAICKDENGYLILDWKMKNLPKNPQTDLQSVVYLYCANKIFNTENISMVYCSISTLEKVKIEFDSSSSYYKHIFETVSKVI